jgi:hypothetical protein
VRGLPKRHHLTNPAEMNVAAQHCERQVDHPNRMRQDKVMQNGRDDATFTGADRTSNSIWTHDDRH